MKQIVEFIDVSLKDKSGSLLLDNVDFSLSSGATVIIGGPPGIEKTAMIELIIGSYNPNKGAVLVFEKKLNARKLRAIAKMRKQIGGAGGIFNLISYQSVYENIRYPLVLKSEGGNIVKDKLTKKLTGYGLIGKKSEKAGNLSRGDKILTLLARATIADQELLLIDEPLAGLDSETASKINDILSELSVAGHSMIILTTDVSAVRIPNASVVHLENGRIK